MEEGGIVPLCGGSEGKDFESEFNDVKDSEEEDADENVTVIVDEDTEADAAAEATAAADR